MRSVLQTAALAALATTALAGSALAQASYPCANDLPNPYKLVTDWAQMPRPFAPVNAVTVDANNNFWAADRCEESGCKSVFEIGPDGKTLKNFGADLFVEPHAMAVDKDGNVWVADASAKGAKGVQVTKLAPDGRVLLKLGKPGQGIGSAALDTFDSPTGVAVASDGNIYISQGHGEKQNNSRILIFTKDGKFIKSFASWGDGNGQLKSPHAIAFDSRDRLFVADRSNNRIQIFDQDGKFLAEWRQFGRPSGIYIDKKDMIYVADSQSDEKINPGFKQGIRVGNAKDGKLVAYIPENKDLGSLEGTAADDAGNVYAGYAGAMNFRRLVKK